MRKLIVTENITLDGVIDNTKGWFNPVDDADDPEMIATVADHSSRADAFLVGRQTFEEMRGFWPEQQDDSTGVTDYLNSVAKYVVSSSLEDPHWGGTTILSGDVADEIQKLKDSEGRDIVVTGSVDLVQSLVRLDLVDEYRLFIYPVVVGGGRRLFEADDAVRPLSVLRSKSFVSGQVLIEYSVQH